MKGYKKGTRKGVEGERKRKRGRERKVWWNGQMPASESVYQPSSPPPPPPPPPPKPS